MACEAVRYIIHARIPTRGAISCYSRPNIACYSIPNIAVMKFTGPDAIDDGNIG